MTPGDERRLVTVLFADLVGFTGLAERTDPEEVRDLQRGYFAAVAGEVERFGGSVEKYIGDAVMALFGAPTAHDDDAERALRTAVRIREVVAGIDGDLEVRIGVNTGEVVGGMGTGPQADDYTVSGDAVNVAARLQQHAAPGEILVGGTTRALSAEAFAFAPLAEMTVKGRSEPIEAWRLERQLPERPRTRGGEARLVGRGRELAAIESALGEANDGRGLMTALVGEAGIGKSRLALEARHRAEANGFASAWTTSRPYASAFPYHVVAQLLRQLLARDAGEGTQELLRNRGVSAGDEETLGRWAAAIDDALGEGRENDPRLADVSAAGRQRLLVHAIGAILRTASQDRPLLIVLDDLHWADPASLAVVEALLETLPDLRVALLATYRSGFSHGWEGRSGYEQLNVRALRPEEARQMADELLSGGSRDPARTARVLERSAGNPFFLEELLRGEHRSAAQAAQRLPETIHEVLLARLDALPADARRTLQLASVVGTEFSEPIVEALADGNGTDAALRALQRAELIVRRPAEDGQDTLAFRHPLIHEVAYRSLLMSARRQLHGRIGRWLEEHGGDELLSELARHYRDSDDVDRARHFLPLAAARAERLNASSEAHGLYTDAAAAFTDDTIRRAEMLEGAGRQRYVIGEIAAAIEQQADAIRLYESTDAELAALNGRAWLGRLYWLDGNPEQADAEIGRAIDGLERLPPSAELAYAYSNRSQSIMLRPDYAEGAAWARKAIAVAEATGATAALVHAYNNLGHCLLSTGDPAGVDHLRRSLALALEHHLTDDAGRAYANISGQGSRVFPFPHAESEALLREAMEFARNSIPDGVFDQWIQSGYAEFLLVTGRWLEADRVLDSMHHIHAGAYMASGYAALRAHLAAYRGRFEEAEPVAREAVEDAARIGDLQAVLPAQAVLATTQAGLEDVAGAISSLRRGVERRGTQQEIYLSSWFAFEAVDTLAAAASPARTAGVQLLAGFASTVHADLVGAGAMTSARISRALFGAAVEQLGVLDGGRAVELPTGYPGRHEAAVLLDQEQRRFDAARIRLWLAEEAGDPSLLAGADGVFADLGAHRYLERARASGGGR